MCDFLTRVGLQPAGSPCKPPAGRARDMPRDPDCAGPSAGPPSLTLKETKQFRDKDIGLLLGKPMSAFVDHAASHIRGNAAQR